MTKKKIILFISIISGLKFDGEYIISYLLNNGYECVKTKKERKDKTFSCLIGEMGQFYSIEVYFHVTKSRVQKVTFYDSYKIIAMGVETIAEKFKLPIRKLKIDYKEYREVGHILTKEEIDYIRNDVEIMARALEIMFKENLTHMTIGANALSYYRKMNNYFNNLFPEIPFEIDKSIRTSYKGGFTYLNPLYAEEEVVDGIVLDVNSLRYILVLCLQQIYLLEHLFILKANINIILYILYMSNNLVVVLKLKKVKYLQYKLKMIDFIFQTNI